jgi:hypothetical protein
MRDLDIRINLKNYIEFEHTGVSDTIVIDELGICQGESRIDIAVINGEIQGYEIKSEYDTLNRLPIQVELYNKVFDRVTLVSAESHYAKACKIIPDWWGIIIAVPQKNNGIILRNIREAVKNKNTDAYYIAQLLWKDEAISVIKDYIPNSKLSSKNRVELWNILVNLTSKEELCAIVRDKLKHSEFRHSWRSDSLLKLNGDLFQPFSK